MKCALLAMLVASCQAFQLPHAARSIAIGAASRAQAQAVTSLNALSKKQAKIAEEQGYWQGEWVCADCGYIYDAELFGGLFFEQQTKGFKCPQCSGPRRRYAKKLGDTVGVTLDGGDGPILAASFGGLVITIALGVYFSSN